MLPQSIPTDGIPKPSTIVFRVYGLDKIHDDKIEELRNILARFFSQAVSSYRGNIIIYADLPAGNTMPSWLFQIQILIYQLRYAISAGLGFNVEIDFQRL